MRTAAHFVVNALVVLLVLVFLAAFALLGTSSLTPYPNRSPPFGADDGVGLVHELRRRHVDIAQPLLGAR
jgi:hypothetical protein